GYSTDEVKRIIGSQGDAKTGQESQTGQEGQSDQESRTKAPDKAPNIIVVMNESFADLKKLGDLKLSRDYMPYFRSLKNTIRGYTYTSVFGGNTANSEFEFLTGNSLAFLPDNSVPYQLFLRDQVPGLTRTLKDQGYSPDYALHPYYNTGYSRYKIYPLMGFDRFYTSDDFSLFTDTVNYHITDEENYQKLIEIYEKNKKKDSPFYMFNVTMQNHGSYDGTLYETGNDVQIEGALSHYSRVEQYLNMMRMSDDALKDLVEYFEKEKDPTVILFFGDHQPDLDEEFYNALLGKEISELQGEELEKLYQVPFLIWANYDIEDRYVERTSNNYLATYVAEIAGIETTGYLDYLARLREEIPCINALGYWGANGNYYDLNDKSSPYYQKIREYRFLAYNNIFGKEDQIGSFFYLNGKQEDN
ncbi:MAG: LTA synthase family protein, partial [Eubacterium sp.]|nr:LTA synthase family protein [Eubacterium sp.]